MVREMATSAARIQRENRNPSFGLMQVSVQQLQSTFFSLLQTYRVPPCIEQMQLSGDV
jgi:hypothetical protein